MKEITSQLADDSIRSEKFLELLPESYIRHLSEELVDSRVRNRDLKPLDIFTEYQKNQVSRFKDKELNNLLEVFNKSLGRFYGFIGINFSTEPANPEFLGLYPLHREKREARIIDSESGSNKKSWNDLRIELQAIVKDLVEKYTAIINTLNSPTDKNAPPTDVEFNEVTGEGKVGIKSFKFKFGKPEFEVFRILFRSMNRKIERIDVLIAIGRYKDYESEKPEENNSNTILITEIAKRIRKKTGLNPQRLVQNQGSLILKGKKILS